MMLLGVDLGGVLLERKGGSSELAGLKRDGVEEREERAWERAHGLAVAAAETDNERRTSRMSER